MSVNWYILKRGSKLEPTYIKEEEIDDYSPNAMCRDEFGQYLIFKDKISTYAFIYQKKLLLNHYNKEFGGRE